MVWAQNEVFQILLESKVLVFDVIEMCDILDIHSYLVAIDIEKAFDSLDHNFLSVLLIP